MKRTATALACTVLSSVLMSWATPAAAIEGGGGVGAAPAPGAPGVLAGGGYFAPAIYPGSTWTSELLVENDSATRGPIVVYAADGRTSANSGAAYGDAGQSLRAAGAWVDPSSQTVIVPAQGQATVRFSVTVPPTALPGDYLAGIAAQSGTLVHGTSGHIRVNVVARSVVGILVRVPGPASFDASVGKPTIGAGPDQIGEVVTPVTDTGRLIGRPMNRVWLSGPNGYRKNVTKQIDTLLPGGTAHFEVYWPDRLHGTYLIKSCVSGSGLSHPVCNTATVVVAGLTKNIHTLRTRPKPGGLHLPGWAVAILSATVGAILAALLLRRRQAGGPVSPAVAPRPVPTADPWHGPEAGSGPASDVEDSSDPVLR